MKRLLICAAIIVFTLLAAPQSQAHILKTDGTVGATIHISPDDDPVIGEPATFYFDFKDTAQKFTVEDCQCSVTITENGEKIFSQPLTTDRLTYVFPKRGVYSVMVSGQPKTPNTFVPFTLPYDIRVTKTAARIAPQPNNLGTIIRIGVIVATIFFFLILVISSRNRTKTHVTKTKLGKKHLIIIFLMGTVSVLHLCHVIKPLLALHDHNSHPQEQHQPCCIPLSVVAVTHPSLDYRAITSTRHESVASFTPVLSINIVENIRPPPFS